MKKDEKMKGLYKKDLRKNHDHLDHSTKNQQEYAEEPGRTEKTRC